jgi:hypothetical protein
MRSGLQRLTHWFYSTNSNPASSAALINSSSSNYGAISIDVDLEESKTTTSHREILERIAQESRLRTTIYRNDQSYRKPLKILALLGAAGGTIWTFKTIWNYADYLSNSYYEIHSKYADFCPADYQTFSSFDPICWDDPTFESKRCDEFYPDQYCAAEESAKLNFHLLYEDCLLLLNQMCKEKINLDNKDDETVNNFLNEGGAGLIMLLSSASVLYKLHMKLTTNVNQAEREAMAHLRAAGVVPYQEEQNNGQELKVTTYEAVNQQLEVLRRDAYLEGLIENLLAHAPLPNDLIMIVYGYLCTFNAEIKEINAALMLLRCRKSQIPLVKGKIAHSHYQFLQDSQSRMLPAIIFDTVGDYVDLEPCGLVLMELPIIKKNAVPLGQIESLEIKRTIEENGIGVNAMYVRMGWRDKYLIYVNQARNEFFNIKLSKQQFIHFDKILKPTFVIKALSHAELVRIQEITKHDHHALAENMQQLAPTPRLA